MFEYKLLTNKTTQIIDAYLTEHATTMKATSSIGPSKPHHKHTQTDIQTGQLMETGAEVSPGS